MLTTIEKKVWDLIEAGVDDLDLRLVRVRINGGEGSLKVQIMLEPKAASAAHMVSVTIDECEAVSRMTSALMDVEDPIEGRYTLEVSSTGLERPLVKERDFDLYKGMRAKVEMIMPVDGRRRFFGEIKGIDGEGLISMKMDEGDDVLLPYSDVKFAHLVFTDEQMNEFMKSAKE